MWKPIETIPERGQVLVTDDELAGTDLSPDEGYGTIELVVCPMLADGRILNQNSGNYSRPGTWKWWAPVPARRTTAGAQREEATTSFQPDWRLTLRDQIAIALSLLMSRHVPTWGGATDEQLDAVAADVIATLAGTVDATVTVSDAVRAIRDACDRLIVKAATSEKE